MPTIHWHPWLFRVALLTRFHAQQVSRSRPVHIWKCDAPWQKLFICFLWGSTWGKHFESKHFEIIWGKTHFEVKTFFRWHMNSKKGNNFERKWGTYWCTPFYSMEALCRIFCIWKHWCRNSTSRILQSANSNTCQSYQCSSGRQEGKAIEIRSFCHVLVHLWAKFHNPNLQIHRQILLLLKLSGQIDAVLEEYEGEYALPAPAALKFKKLVFNMGYLVILLENHFKNEEGVPHLFTATSKLHGVAHAALWAEFVSPRLVWCFTGEDYMHHVQSLAQSCIAGTGPYLTVNKTVDKMRVALHIQFTKGEINWTQKQEQLWKCTLEGNSLGSTALSGAHFESYIHFQGSKVARLWWVHCESHTLWGAHFEGNTLRETKKCYRILTNVLQNRFKTE